MKVIPAVLPGVLIVEPAVHEDRRGFFMETWHAERYMRAGIPGPFVQDNLAYSVQGVLRGLHFQHPYGQGKLVYVPRGEVFDVVVDVRRGSPHFGQWLGIVLSAQNGRQLYIPPGFAHGYLVTSPDALLAYKCTDYYDPPSERGIRWDDPDIGIEWPEMHPVLSDKDRGWPRLKELPGEVLPVYGQV